MKILELNIKDDLDKGVSWDEIAKKYGVGKSKIQKIKQHGCWYVDLGTGERVFTSKSVSLHEQLFHHIASQIELFDKSTYIEKKKLIKDRAVAPRICNWLMGKFNIEPSMRDSMERKCRGWHNKDVKLVKSDETGKIDFKIKELAYDFYINEESVISKNYYLDENFAPRGWRLWSFKISDDWLVHLSPYIATHIITGYDEPTLREYMYNNLLKSIERDREELIKSGLDKKQIEEELDDRYKKKLRYNFINSRVSIRIVQYVRKIYGDISNDVIIYNSKIEKAVRSIYLNPILYMDITAYRMGLLSREYSDLVKLIMETGMSVDMVA